MSGFLKSLTGLLAYLGRGAVPADGLYFPERTRPAAAACGHDGAAGWTETLVQKKFRAGYRVLM